MTVKNSRFRAVMMQSWRHLAFLHWRYRPEQIRAAIPSTLTLDVFENAAWVSVTPFSCRIRLPFVPTIPYLSRFPETNCRTYVRTQDGAAGIWFFSLDAARLLAVAGARLTYGLPYAWSRMRLSKRANRVSYSSRRRWPDRTSAANIEIEIGPPLDPSPLSNFLAERYRLFALRRGRLISAPVQHPPWPLHDARIVRLEQTLTGAAGIPEPADPPIVHFSPGVHVRVGSPLLRS